MEKLKIGGTYKHYKGQLYKVLQIVRHSETLEEMVYYQCLYQNDLGTYWVRPIDLFVGFNELGEKRFELIE